MSVLNSRRGFSSAGSCPHDSGPRDPLRVGTWKRRFWRECQSEEETLILDYRFDPLINSHPVSLLPEIKQINRGRLSLWKSAVTAKTHKSAAQRHAGKLQVCTGSSNRQTELSLVKGHMLGIKLCFKK